MNPGEESCKWVTSDDGYYETQCENAFEFLNGGLKENGLKFCPYCGKPIENFHNT